VYLANRDRKIRKLQNSEKILFQFFGQGFFFGDFFVEFIDATHGVDQSGFTGIKRVASRTGFGFDVFFSRANIVNGAARAFDAGVRIIFRMNVFFMLYYNNL